MNDTAIDPVCESIKTYGFGAPLLARRANGELIAGHTRLKAAIKLGLDKVPVRYLDLDEKQAHQLALADNRLGELAAWDDAELLDVLREFSPEEQLVAGWSENDIAALERAARGASGGGELIDDEPPPLPKVPITKLGDVWQLGRHRLVCGDSRDVSVLERLLEGRRPGLLTTDPPYGVSAKTGTRDPRFAVYQQGEERNRTIEGDDLKGAQLEGFLRAAFETVAACLAPGASWYVWFPGSNPKPFFAACEIIGGMRHQLVWVKSKFALGRSDYHYRHEVCLYGWTPGAKHTWLGSRDQSTVWEVALDKAVGELVHPSVKPVELYARPVQNHLGADGAVLDIFAGTGPAVSAAEQLGRAAYMVELDGRYCDVIVGRWEALSGGRAVRRERSGSAPRAKAPKAKKAPAKAPQAVEAGA